MTRVFNTMVVSCFSVLFASSLGAEKAEAGSLPAAGNIALMDVTPRVKSESEDARLFQAVNDSFDIRTASVQTLGFAERSESSLTTAIVVDGNTWTLELQKYSVRSPDFEVWVQDASGRLTLVEPPPAQTYVGTVLELPGSEVRASYNDGEIEAVVYTSDGIFGIQPLTKAGIAAQIGDHAVYRNSDWVNRRGYTCATNVGQHVFDGLADLEEVPEDTPNAAWVDFDLAQIALDADFEFYQLNGSNVNSTILDMENVINGLETIYENQLNITYEVSSVVVRTAEPDPYSSTAPSTLLGQLVTHWNASPQSAVQRDLLHLFTGKNLDGTVIGIAYVGAVCNRSWAYGLSQSRFTASMPSRVALSAHEIGHNWNAQHCNGCTACADCCRIMCSGLGGCSGILTSFGCQEVSQMAAFRDTRTCLGPAPPDECTTNVDCDDGLGCTVDTCVTGSCQHTAVNCNDNVACTADACVEPNGTCTHTPNNTFCNPTNSFCSAAGCDPILGCVYDHECISDDGNPCPHPATCNDTTNTCGGCNAPSVVAGGSRYLLVTPAAQGSTPVALRVFGDCGDAQSSCVAQYVQSKCNGGSNNGLNCNTDANCPKRCVGGPTNGAVCTIASDCPLGACAGICDTGTLAPTPYYKTASQWGTAKVRGAQIRPGADYLVETACNFPGVVSSAAANARTWKWGDVDNNGIVNAIDVTNLVNAFKGFFGPFTFEQMNLFGCVPDDVLNTLDISVCVDAFRGFAYPCGNTCP